MSQTQRAWCALRQRRMRSPNAAVAAAMSALRRRWELAGLDMDVLGGAGRRSLEELVAARANFNITGRGRRVLLSWAPFVFTHMARNVSWQATCPYHRKNKSVGCRKTAKVVHPFLEGVVSFSTRARCAEASFGRRPDTDPLSPSDVLDAQMPPGPRADQPINDDDKLSESGVRRLQT